MKILDANGNPFKWNKSPQTMELGTRYLHREYEHHPAFGITPQRIKDTFLLAERGVLWPQCDLASDIIELDAQIHSEMQKRARAVLLLSWSITPPYDASRKEKKAAKIIEETIKSIDDLEDVFLTLMDAVLYGYSCLEIATENNESGWQLIDGMWTPQFQYRPQRMFCSKYDRQDDLFLRDSMSENGAAKLIPFGWIKHVHKSISGYIPRCGLIRAIAFPFLFKNFTLRDLAQMLETYGQPIKIGKYGAGATENDRMALFDAIKNIGRNAGGIIPDDMSLELIEVAKAGAANFELMIGLMDNYISKLILGGTLTSQTSGGGGGAYALGEVHNEVRKELLVSDARQLATTLTRDLVWPLQYLNTEITNANRRCKFEFKLEEKKDDETVLETISALHSLLPISASWVRERFGFPEPTNDDDILGGKKEVKEAVATETIIATEKEAEPSQQKQTETKVAPKQNALHRHAHICNSQQDDELDTLKKKLVDAAPNALQKIISPIIDAVDSADSFEELDRFMKSTVKKIPDDGMLELLEQGIATAYIYGLGMPKQALKKKK